MKDVLQDGCVEKDKVYCLKHQLGNARDYFKKHHTNVKFEPVRVPEYGVDEKSRPIGASYSHKGSGGGSLVLDAFNENKRKQKFDYIVEPVNTTFDGKARTIKAQYQSTSPRNICCYTSTYGASGVAKPIRIGALPRPNGELSTSQGMRVYSADGKSVNLTSSGGGMGGKEHDVYTVKNGLITIKDKQYPINLNDGYYIIRKLTVTECMRLQTVPEWYQFKDVISDSQAYKCLGNGWTVQVITHLILGVMKNESKI